MFINDEKFYKFILAHHLSPGQFLLCYTLSTIDRNHKFLKRMIDELGFIVTPEEVEDLDNRGYILNMNQPGEHYHDMLVVSDKFKQAIIVDAEDAFDQVWKAYPIRLQQHVNGSYPLAKTTSIGKEGLQRKYAKYISNDFQKHLRVMEVLIWFKERQKITVGIEKFILNQLWDDWETEMEGESNGTGNEYGIEVD